MDTIKKALIRFQVILDCLESGYDVTEVIPWEKELVEKALKIIEENENRINK